MVEVATTAAAGHRAQGALPLLALPPHTSDTLGACVVGGPRVPLKPTRLVPCTGSGTSVFSS